MPMISTTTLQPPTNGLSTIKSMHALIFVVEIMASIFAISLMIRIVLLRTRLSLAKIGIILQDVVTMVEDVLMVVGIKKVKAIMSRTSLE